MRQKVDHKRTFFYLEQLILKHRVHEKASQIESQPDGVDFFFVERNHALRFLDFLQETVPIKYVDCSTTTIEAHFISCAVTVSSWTCFFSIIHICR